MKRKLTSILSMDVAGYSTVMERDETGTVRRLKEMRERLFDPRVSAHSGRVVKLMGDGALIEFASVVDALTCAIELQSAVKAHNAKLPEPHRMQFRAGVHLGDVLVDDGDIYGDGVNVAARLEDIAPPGGVVFSKQVHDQIHGSVDGTFVSLGPQKVKGLQRPIEAFRVEMTEAPRPVANATMSFGECQLLPDLFELRRNGKPVQLEPQAFELLVLLARNAGKLVTKDQIFAEIWNNRVVSDSALSSQVKAARKAVGDSGSAQSVIATVHGRGFRFVAPLTDRVGSLSERVEDLPDPASRLDPLPPAIPALESRPSVAVLPFANMNRDKSEDYLADGITEDITIALARNRWLTVVARNPAFAFRNSTESLREIGRQLQAQYLVTGSVRKAGNRFRITVEMVESDTEHSVWSERYDRDGVDIFDLQDDISEMVAARIETELGLAEQKRAKRVPRQNRGAWDMYQLGVAEFYKFTTDTNARSQELLRRAIEIDPLFPAAYSRLAYAIVLSMIYFDAPPEQAVMDEALQLAQRGIELDDQDANGYFTIGRIHLARQEYGLAIEALEHALELNPCLAVTYCGLGDSLAYEGRLDEAIAQFETAIRLSPHDPFRWAFYSYRSLAHLFQGDYEAAVIWARRSLRIPNAQYWAQAHLTAALGHLGDPVEIAAARQDLLEIKPEFTVEFAREHLFYLKLPGQLQTYLEGLRLAGVPGD
ncbi:winged helix-turn-helix domain-containing protein [Primorskyibacter sp. S87]|uniref:winged helix-turn-helix domain-containing protein n=1 Tax=Primorskyibacter sp. S87 TaxID=3415126 RepID=UPI003C7DC6D9